CPACQQSPVPPQRLPPRREKIHFAAEDEELQTPPPQSTSPMSPLQPPLPPAGQPKKKPTLRERFKNSAKKELQVTADSPVQAPPAEIRRGHLANLGDPQPRVARAPAAQQPPQQHSILKNKDSTPPARMEAIVEDLSSLTGLHQLDSGLSEAASEAAP
uniref:WH2 domain-containing protein n=1 Tax=Macrostomum lignano TaxID=282301 RepID=A0A1I8IH34_9PLAT